MLGWIKKVFGGTSQLDPYEEFATAFLHECKRQNILPNIYDPRERAFHFEALQKTVFLDKIFYVWTEADIPERSEHLTRFVRGIKRNEPPTSETLRAQLMPAVRPRAIISETEISNQICDPGLDERDPRATFPFVSEFRICLAMDEPENIVWLGKGILGKFGLTDQDALTIAMQNFRAQLHTPKLDTDEQIPGLYRSVNLKDYQANMLLLTPSVDYAVPDIDGDPVIILPDSTELYMTGSRNVEGLNGLIEILKRARQSPLAYPPILLRWSDGWSEFSFGAGTPQDAALKLLQYKDQTRCYANQKELLNRLYERQNRDIFVASFTAYEAKPPHGLISTTSWSSGVTDGLLPKTDLITFVDQILDPKTGLAKGEPRDIIRVAWTDVEEIVGHLLSPVPELYPPRFHFTRFPGSDEWVKLKAREFSLQ